MSPIWKVWPPVISGFGPPVALKELYDHSEIAYVAMPKVDGIFVHVSATM